ncbi:MAG: MarR family winged helix-turn-helix transcriptional regulator [Pontibacterium sp.]
MSYDQLQLKNQLCHRLYKASNGVVRSYREHLKVLDVTYPQYVVLMALWEKDDVAVAELLLATAVDGGALTQILKKMAQKQLLEVVRDPSDGRQRRVRLLAKGQALQAQAVGIPEALRCRVPHMSDEELHQLVTLLDKLNGVFERNG